MYYFTELAQQPILQRWKLVLREIKRLGPTHRSQFPAPGVWFLITCSYPLYILPPTVHVKVQVVVKCFANIRYNTNA